MKRAAERQGGRDVHSDEEMDEGVATGVMRTADEKVLMKGLPRRGLAATTPQEMQQPSNIPPADGDTAERFKFGDTATSAAPFSFTASTSSARPQTNMFSSSSSSGSNLFGASSQSQPKMAFSSSVFTTPSSSSADHEFGGIDEEAFGTLKSLRGLNVAFMKSVRDILNEDAFYDLSSMFEQYESFKSKIPIADQDHKSHETSKKAEPLSSNKSNFPSTTATSKPASTPPASMPKPASAFAGFSFPSSTSTPSKDTGNGSSSSKPFSGFSFSASSAASSEAPKANPFSFAAQTEKKSDALPPAPKPAFSFSGFGSSPSKPTTESDKPQSVFGSSSTFGFSKDTPSSNPFGSSTSAFSAFSNAASSSGSTTPTPVTPALSFGSSTTGSSFGAFGSKGSIGNPVGFSFGSPTPTPEPEAPSTDKASTPASPFATSSASAFASGKDKAVDLSNSGEQKETENMLTSRTLSPASTDDSRAMTPATETDESSKLLGSNPHDEEGEGEEEEETTHSSRLKVYKLKFADGKPQWGDMGIGVLRLKKHKMNGSRRMLLRNSGTGKITINFNIFPSLKPTREKNAISFVGHDEGKPATFRLRLKTEDQAKDLQQALDREIEFVKAKDSSL